MKNEPFELPFLIALVLFAFSLVALVGLETTNRNLKTEAVSRGFATWEVKNDGSTRFQWKKALNPENGTNLQVIEKK